MSRLRRVTVFHPSAFLDAGPHPKAQRIVGAYGLVYWIVPPLSAEERRLAELRERDRLRARLRIAERRVPY